MVVSKLPSNGKKKEKPATLLLSFTP